MKEKPPNREYAKAFQPVPGERGFEKTVGVTSHSQDLALAREKAREDRFVDVYPKKKRLGKITRALIAGGVLVAVGRETTRFYPAGDASAPQMVIDEQMHLSEVKIRYPEDQLKKVDNLASISQISDALGITLSSDPNQLLYTIELSGSDKDGKKHNVTFDVTQKNIKQGASIIDPERYGPLRNEDVRLLLSGNPSPIAPDAFDKPPSTGPAR